MTAREISITAVISNLSQIQEQLRNLTGSINLTPSGDLETLLAASRNGLNINVRLTFVSEEFRQLLDISRNGLNINVRSPNLPIGSNIRGSSTPPPPPVTLGSSSGATLGAVLRRVELDAYRAAGDVSNLINQNNALVQSHLQRLASFSPGEIVDTRNRSLSQLRAQAEREANQSNGLTGSYNKIYPNLSARGANFLEKEREAEAVQARKSQIGGQRVQEFTAKALADQAIQDFKSHKSAETLRESLRKQAEADEKAARKAAESEAVNNLKSNQSARKLAQLNAEESLRPQLGPSSKLFFDYQEKQEKIYKRANQELAGADLFSFESKKRGFIERDLLDPSKLQARRKAFDITRLTQDREAAQAFFFSGLLGGPGNALGGAIGGATIGGATGVLAGTTAISAAVSSFQKLSEILSEASDKAAEFSRSISAIAGIIGATTDVTRNGEPLTGIEAFNFNRKEANKLALAGRKSLLPLGFTVGEEQSLTQAFLQSRFSQGFRPSEQQTSDVLRNFGAFVKLNAGDIPAQRLFKDAADIFSGSPGAGRTQLGLRLKSLTPELFQGKALSDEQLTNVISRLGALSDALSRGDDFLTQRLQIEGKLSNLQLTIGDSLNKGLLPGFQALNATLSDPSIQTNLAALGEQIGRLGSNAIRNTIHFGDVLQDNPLIAGTIALGRTLGRGPFLTLNAAGQPIGTENPPEQEETATSSANAQTQLTNILRNYGTSPEALSKTLDFNPSNSAFAKLYLANAQLPKGLDPEQRDRLKLALRQSEISGLEQLQQEKIKTVDTGTLGGAFNANAINKGFIQSRTEELEASLKQQKETVSKLFRPGTVPSTQEGIEAASRLRDTELQLAKVRAEGAINARELVDLGLKEIDLQKQGFNTNLFSGRQGLATATISANQEKISSLEYRLNTGKLDSSTKEEIKAQIRTFQAENAQERDRLIENKINLNNLATQGLDTFTIGGKTQANRAIIETSGKNIGLLQDQLNTRSGSDNDEIQAKIRIEDTRRNDAIRNNVSLGLEESGLQTRGFNTQTFQGKFNELQAEFRASKERSTIIEAALQKNPELFNNTEFLAQKREELVKQQQLPNALTNQKVSIYDSLVQLENAFLNLKDTTAALDDKEKELTLDRTKIQREKDDFNFDTNLRRLTRKENILQAADKVSALGGIPDVPASLLGLVNTTTKVTQVFDKLTEQVTSLNEQLDKSQQDYNKALGINTTTAQGDESAEAQIAKKNQIEGARQSLLSVQDQIFNKGLEGLPTETASNFSFRKRFELELAKENLSSIGRKNSEERGEIEDDEQNQRFDLSLNANAREKADIPRQKFLAKYAFFKQALELAQQLPADNKLAQTLNSQLVNPTLSSIDQLLGEQGLNFKLSDVENQKSEEHAKTIGDFGKNTGLFERFKVGDREKGESAAAAITRQKQEFAASAEQLKKDLTADTRTLSSLTKADLVDSINSGASLALNSSFA